RDDKSKTHPNLVDYEALDEPTKQYDRDQILGTGNMLRALAASSKKST
ncbi:MAG: RyR domain-containing protein, partial [Limisphaerales bacterium]